MSIFNEMHVCRTRMSALSFAISAAVVSWAAHAEQTLPIQAETDASAAAGAVVAAEKKEFSAEQQVIVTGTRRQARLQSVPVAMSVLSSKDIANSGFASASDLQYVVPSVNFNAQVGAGFLIRGVGSQGFDYNLEKAVSVIVDDVVQGLPRSIGFNTMTDIERIEVLKGPQGTLFGKNASAGAIFVVTRQPELGQYDLTGNVRFGNRNEVVFENTVNLPTSEQSALRLSTAFQRRDGYLNNKFWGFRAGTSEDSSIRGKFLWKPSKDMDVNIVAEFQDHRDDGASIIETIRSYVAPATPISPTSQSLQDYTKLLSPYGVIFGPQNRDFVQNYASGTAIRQKGLTGNLTYRFNDYTLTSVSAFKNQRSSNSSDSDNSATDFNSLNISTLAGRQYSQEFRLNSPAVGFYDYVIGAFYYNQDVSATEAQGGNRNTVLPIGTYISPVGALGNYTANSISRAAFGQANFHLTNKWTAILGGRYTRDNVSASYFPSKDGRFTFTGPILPAVGGASEKGKFSGKATLQYQATPDIMTYVNVAQGYKAPAIGTSRGAFNRVKEETVEAYEIGAKTQFFDRKLTLNASVYKQDFKNFQTQTAAFNADGTSTFILANAPGMESNGAELDARLRVTSGLTLTSGFSFNPTKYKGFLTSCYAGQTINPAAGPGCYAIGGLKVNDVTGQAVANAPKKSFSVGFDYRKPIGNYQLYSNANYSHRSDAFAVAGDPNTNIEGYGFLNGSIGLGSPDGKVKVSIYGRNLLDKLYVARIRALSFAGAGSYVQTIPSEAQRTIGIKLDYSL
jgi:iron complex outermembrane receptor protein